MPATSYFDKGDGIYVSVTPEDGGTTTGSSMVSSTAVVQNTAPDTPILTVTSSVMPPVAGMDDLMCSLVTATDADNDALTYTYEWMDPSGTVQQTYNNTTAMSDVYLGAGTTSGTWTCQVTVHDGTDSTIGTSIIDVDSATGSCGSILHEDPIQLGVPSGWILCYIDESDTAYHSTPCSQLLQNLDNGWNASDLLSAGGNFGCWHGTSGSSEGASYASNGVVGSSCRNNIQHSHPLDSWNPSNTTFGVCIRYP